ncbi:FAD1 flavin adenine dinucleotide synthetase [Homalodisca vitripennis]|nr:FAD1 flavin adenine dinucleotide synthetase [Homalodisca vitripennis]
MCGRSAGIILVGDEILKGQVKDTNSHFMCKRFRAVGTKVLKISVVEDIVDEIAKTVEEFSGRFDIVVTSGGIGPTHDDVTYAGVAAAFGDKIVCNDILLDYWNKTFNSSVTQSARLLSSVPQSAEIIWANTESVLYSNRKGEEIKTFPVVKVRNVFVLPGVPQYLEALFFALEKDHFQSQGRSFYTGRIYLSVDEEWILKALNKSVQDCKDCVFGSYPVINNDRYKTQITVEAESVDHVKAAEDHFKALVSTQWIVSTTTHNMSSPVYKFLETTADPQLAASLQNSIKIVEQGLKRYSGDSLMLSFNGGKDCTVLLHIILAVWQQLGIPGSLQTVYFRPANPFPEIERFIADTVDR